MLKITLKVLQHREQKIKDDKTIYRQSVLIENSENEEPTIIPLRPCFKPEYLLDPGIYTADLKIYAVSAPDSKGYIQTTGRTYFSNFEKVKQVK